MQKKSKEVDPIIEIRKYFQKFSETSEEIYDLNPYFRAKAAFLNEIYISSGAYVRNLQSEIPEQVTPFSVSLYDCDDNCIKEPTSEAVELECSKTYEEPIRDEIVGRFFIGIYEQMLKENYEPPSSNALGLSAHLSALIIFYEGAAPTEITPEILLKFDYASVKVVKAIQALISSIPYCIQKEKHAKKVRHGKAQQKKETMEKIHNAYKILDPKWPQSGSSKRPIILNKEEISIERLGEKVRDKMRDIYPTTEVPTQNWVVKCIKELKKGGFI